MQRAVSSAIPARMLARSTFAHLIATLLLAAFAASAAGCQVSLPYAPRPSPRVQIVERRLMKDGGFHPLGEIGALVQGNPAAEVEARAYGSSATVATVLNTMGFVTDLGGLGLIAGGAGARDSSAVGFGLALALVGADFLLFGNIASDRARDHVTNAVNIYNDGLPPEVIAPKAPGSVLPGTTEPIPVP